MRLATRLSIFFVLLTVIPLIIVGYLAYTSGRQMIEQNLINHLTSVTIFKEDEFNRWIEDSGRSIHELANRPNLSEWTATISTRDPMDAEYQTARREILANYLEPAVEEESGFLSLFILRAEDGLILLSTDKTLDGEYRASEPFFMEGQNSTYIENINYSLTHKSLVMHISTPVRDKEENLLAVLAGHVDLTVLSEMMEQRSGLSASENTYLVNDSNLFVTTPPFASEEILQKTVHTNGVQACLANQNGTGFYNDYRGVPVIGAYRWVPGREVCILTEVNQDEAYAPIVILQSNILGIGLVTVLIVLLLGLLVARNITQPVNQLIRGTEAIGNGNLDYRIHSNAKDEIGRLSNALDSMAAKLQTSLGDTARGRRTMSALGQSAQAVQRARTPAEVYQAVGDAIASLGNHVLVFTLSEDNKKLLLQHHTYRSSLVRTGEKLIGISPQGFYFDIQSGSYHSQIIQERKARFFDQPEDVLSDSLRTIPLSVIRSLIHLLDFENLIYAPLLSDNTVIGLLEVIGKGLSEEDLPAIAAFANQTAIALENAQYRQHMEELVKERAAKLVQTNEELAAEITKHKQAADDLRRSESVLEQAQRVAHVGSWIWHIQTNRLEWSDEMYHIFGIRREEFTGDLADVIARAIHPDDRAAVEQVNLSVSRDKKPVPLEYRVLWPDGTVRTVWAEAGELLLDDSGRPAILTGIVQDITERKTAEEERRRREKTFQAFVETTKEWIWAIDLEGRHTYCNPALEAILGYSPEDFIGKESLPFIHDEDRPQVQSLLQEKRTAKEGWSGLVLRWRHKNGSYRFLESNAVPILDDEGRLIGYQGADRDITERKQAEEELRQSEEDFRQLFEAESDAILLIDNQTSQILQANHAACSLYGYDQAALLGMKNTDLSAEPEETHRITQETPPASERVITIPLRWHRKKDGTRFPVEITGRFFLHRGRPVHIAAIRDITERRRAEEALRDSRRMLQTVLDSIPSAVFWKDRSLNYLGGNHTWLEAIGLKTADEAVGKSDYDLPWGKKEADSYREFDRRVMESGISEYDIIEPYRKADGTLAWAKTNKVPLRDTEGNIIGILGTYEDITERKHSEEALRESEDKFRSIFQNSTAGVALVGLDGRYLMVNPAFSRIFGYSAEEFTTVDFFQITHPEDVEKSRDFFRRVQEAKGNSYAFTKRYIHKDGHTIWADVSSMMMYSDDGQPLYFTTHVLDITERRRAEEEIRRLNAELEQRVRDRTAQLEEANREMEAFSYSVSHDLRAPLRGIDGWSLALLEDYQNKLDDRGREYLHRVRSESQYMGQLIDDLLQLSRVTRSDLEKTTVDLSAIARSIAKRLGGEFPNRKIDFAIQSGLKARGDPRLIEIALANLLENACKFTGPRRVARIEFGRAGVEQGNAFFIRDNGVGFNMAYADKLFGAFQRMHKASEFPGTGVGLATVRRIIHRHGGKVWADARLNEGATFYFTLGESA